MNKQELIELLEDYPNDTDVFIDTGHHGYALVIGARFIRVVNTPGLILIEHE